MSAKLCRRLIVAMIAGTIWFAAGATTIRAQESAKKFDRFGSVNAEDAMARLDAFAIEIKSHPESRALIVANNTTRHDIPRGTFLRRAYGYREYLVQSRGVEPARVSVVEGERKREVSFELWTLPANELSTISEESSAPEPATPQLFDQLSFGPHNQCVGQLPVELYRLQDGLRILSDAMQRHARAKAWIIVHPRPQDSQAATRRLIDESRQMLIKNHIKADRILTATGTTRSLTCGAMNLWIAPANSTKADEAGYYEQLLSEAGTNHYTMRRVEFVGNQHIRDNLLRKQFVQGEGDIFSRNLLEQSFANIGKLGLVYPVSFNDVEVRLAPEEKLIDLTVYLRERRPRR